MECHFITGCSFDRLLNKQDAFASENQPKQMMKFDENEFARILRMFKEDPSKFSDDNDDDNDDMDDIYNSEQNLTFEIADFIKDRLKLKENDDKKSPPDHFSFHGIEEWERKIHTSTIKSYDLIINVLILNLLKLSSISYHKRRYVECNAYSTVAMTLIRMVKDSSKLKYITKYFVYYEYVAKVLTTHATSKFYKSDHQETCPCLEDFKVVWNAYGKIVEEVFADSEEKLLGPFVSLMPVEKESQSGENSSNAETESTEISSLGPDENLEKYSSDIIKSLNPKPVSSMDLDTFDDSFEERIPISEDETGGTGSDNPLISNSETEKELLYEEMLEDQSVSKKSDGSTDGLEDIPEDKPLDKKKEIDAEKYVEREEGMHRDGETPEGSQHERFNMGIKNLGSSGFHMSMQDAVFHPEAMFNVNAFTDTMLTGSAFMKLDTALLANFIFIKFKRARTAIADIVNDGFNQSKTNIEKLKSIAKELEDLLEEYPAEYRHEHPYKMIAREFLNVQIMLFGSVNTEEKAKLLEAYDLDKIRELCVVTSSVHYSHFIILSNCYSMLVRLVLPQFKKASDNYILDENYDGLDSLITEMPMIITEESELNTAATPTIARLLRLSMILKISVLLPLKEYKNIPREHKEMIKKFENLFDEHINNNLEGLKSVIKLYLDYTYSDYNGSDNDEARVKNPQLEVDRTVKRLLYLTEIIKKYKKGAILKEETKKSNQEAFKLSSSGGGAKSRRRSKIFSRNRKGKKNTSLEQQLEPQDDSVLEEPAPLDNFLISNVADVIEEGAALPQSGYMETDTFEQFISLSRKHLFSKEITELIVSDLSLRKNEVPETIHHKIIPAITEQLEEKLRLFKSDEVSSSLKSLFTEKQVQKALNYLQRGYFGYTRSLVLDLPVILESLEKVEKLLT